SRTIMGRRRTGRNSGGLSPSPRRPGLQRLNSRDVYVGDDRDVLKPSGRATVAHHSDMGRARTQNDLIRMQHIVVRTVGYVDSDRVEWMLLDRFRDFMNFHVQTLRASLTL